MQINMIYILSSFPLICFHVLLRGKLDFVYGTLIGWVRNPGKTSIIISFRYNIRYCFLLIKEINGYQHLLHA